MNTILIPLRKEASDLFRYKITADVLNVLIRNRYRTFSISELAKMIERKENDLLFRKTLKELEKNLLIEIIKKKKLYEISINHEFVYDPSDKFLLISQNNYRIVVQEIIEKLNKTDAVYLFGSVAEGKADRLSDIDIFIVSDSSETEKTAEKIKFHFAHKRHERYHINFYIETTRNFEKLIKNKESVVIKVIKHGIKLFSTERFEKVMRKLVV
ncbi:MAG: nucleotidyltransferase domain-containing protein [Candidatus Aenigmatarchaeota archaeon]